MVGTVGIVLALKAESTAAGIKDTFLSNEASVKEVACVELYTRLVGEHFHEDTRIGVIERAERLGDITFCVQNPVMVISFTILYLNV